MNEFVNTIFQFAEQSIRREKEMRNHFEQMQEESRQLYWDACKYPRKKKKRLRKKALLDYNFYYWLSKPLFNF